MSFATHRSLQIPVTLVILVTALSLLAAVEPEQEKKFALTVLKERPSIASVTEQKGVVGFIRDVDGDGTEELVYAIKKKVVTFRVLSLTDGSVLREVLLDKGHPAGIAALNLDDDVQLEFIVGYGSSAHAMAARVMYGIFVSGGLLGALMDRRPLDIDLESLVAIDDDGTTIWHKEVAGLLPGTSWRNSRLHMMFQNNDGNSATIILSNDMESEVVGVAGRDGKALWRAQLRRDPEFGPQGASIGDDAEEQPNPNKPSEWDTATLYRNGQRLLAFYKHNSLYIFNPLDGSTVLQLQLDVSIADLPTTQLFQCEKKPGFLLLTKGREQLRMISLDSGNTFWSQEMEKVRAILPLDENRFMVVWKHGVRTFSSSGELLDDNSTPFKVNRFEPLYSDLNGDGSYEFIYTSGKKVISWNPQKGGVLWARSLGGLVGARNPIVLYDSFYDLNQDGWLDIPVMKSSGAGRWLSGKSGAILAEVGAGVGKPLAGDWDRDGRPEFYWWKKCYEID